MWEDTHRFVGRDGQTMIEDMVRYRLLLAPLATWRCQWCGCNATVFLPIARRAGVVICWEKQRKI